MPAEPRSTPDAAARALTRRNALALVLGVLASVQMIGYVTGSRILRGLGAASAMAPMPKVFSDVDGLETFASAFTLRYRDARGAPVSVAITPELYARLGGPYNRRNVYGAALSYAPRLPAPLWTAVYCYGLAPEGPVRRELGIPPNATQLSVTISTRTRGRSDTWTLAPSCTR